MSDQSDIQQLLDQYKHALHTKDAKALVACYAPDAMAFEQAPPLAITPAKLQNPDFWQEWFDTWDGPLESTPQKPVLKISGDLAVCYSLVRMLGTKKGGEKVDLWFRSTLVMSKTKQGWKLLHEHNSVPFAMDGSNKALLDLTPESKGWGDQPLGEAA